MGFSTRSKEKWFFIVVKIQCFVCDAPARSYLKQTIAHNGHHGCERCGVVGTTVNNVTVFNGSADVRTDKSFRDQVDKKHHKGLSPLLALSVNLISMFVLDPMHLLCLGIMRTLLYFWVIKGKHLCRLSAGNIERLSNKILQVAAYVPSEFNRKGRSLSELKMWKATEYRLFLLYTGIVVLKNVVADGVYYHFLLLHSAVFIMSSKTFIKSFMDVAEKNIDNFLSHAPKIYGQTILRFNFHNLKHVVEDVKIFGTLWSFSAFVFENFLGCLKRLIRSPYRIHEQLCNRIQELNFLDEEPLIQKEVKGLDGHLKGPLPEKMCNVKQYKKLQMHEYVLKSSWPDCHVQLISNEIVRIFNIVQKNEESDYYIVGRKYKKIDDFYTYPIKSSVLNIHKISDLEENIHLFPVTDIKTKLIVLSETAGNSSSYVSFPLLHLS